MNAPTNSTKKLKQYAGSCERFQDEIDLQCYAAAPISISLPTCRVLSNGMDSLSNSMIMVTMKKGERRHGNFHIHMLLC